MSKPAATFQKKLPDYIAKGQLNLARSALEQGATCCPVGPAANFNLWKETLGSNIKVGKKSPPRYFQGWEFLLEKGAHAPTDQWGLELLAEVLSGHPLVAADWLVDHGLVLPTDHRSLPLVHASLGRPGFKALSWLSERGVPLDADHAQLQPAIRWVIDVRGRNALSWIEWLVEHGVTPKPWVGASPAEPSTPLLKLAHLHVLDHELRSGLPVDVEKEEKFAALWDVLVAAGEDPSCPDQNGLTALDLALKTPFLQRHTSRQRASKALPSPLVTHRSRPRP